MIDPQGLGQVLEEAIDGLQLERRQHFGALGVRVREVGHEPDWPCTNASYAFWSSNAGLSLTPRSLMIQPLP